MNSLHPVFAAIGNLDLEAISYQITGMVVVFSCLVLLSLILTVSGAVAVRLEASRKAQQEAAKAALAAAQPAPAPAAVAPEYTPAQVAALAAGIYDAAASSITPEVVAAIAAAVKVTVGQESRILSIEPVGNAYAQGGRVGIMNSHTPLRG